MKKWVSLLLALVLGLGVCAAALAEGGYEVALVTDIGTIDDKSFNQGTWEGIKAYCEANAKTYNYYQPAGQSDDLYLEKIDQAITDGAKVVVTPGFLFEPSILIAQDMYPEVKFILIDGYPNNGKYDATRVEYTAENTVGIKYAEEQAGYLAGYAAVVDGYTKLGFMGGMAVPAVVRFGYGFVQGADDAAVALGIEKIEINYHYTGDFIASPASHSKAAAWFNDGIEVIFACGGAVGNSVMAAAEETGGKVIGVDVDQSAESETVITSSMKGLASSVEQTLAAYDAGNFPGGQNLVLDATNDGVGLPMETSKFVKFTQADYDELYAKLRNLSVEIQNDEDVENAAELTLAVTEVTLIK